MGARKARMMRKARKLIDFGYKPTFREMMQSYRFWQRVIKRKDLRKFAVNSR